MIARGLDSSFLALRAFLWSLLDTLVLLSPSCLDSFLSILSANLCDFLDLPLASATSFLPFKVFILFCFLVSFKLSLTTATFSFLVPSLGPSAFLTSDVSLISLVKRSSFTSGVAFALLFLYSPLPPLASFSDLDSVV